MSKYTLIIDGNWFLMARASVRLNEFNIEYTEEKLQYSVDELYNLLCKSLINILSQFTFIDNIILVSDNKSWRKSIIKPGYIEAPYKSNRVSSCNVRWDLIFGVLKKLSDNFNDIGLTAYNINGAEGDDCIMYSAKYLNSINTNVLIWSTDADLQQLVSNTNACTVIYNGNSFISHNDFNINNICNEDYLLNMFNLTPAKEFQEKLNNINIPIKYILPDNIVMSKIICGDVSDNISSIITIIKKDKIYSVTNKMLNSILGKHSITTLEEFFYNKNVIISEILKIKPFINHTDQLKSFDKIQDIFEYNTEIIWLVEENYPEYVLEGLKKIPETYKSPKNIRDLVSSLYSSIEKKEIIPLINFE